MYCFIAYLFQSLYLEFLSHPEESSFKELSTSVHFISCDFIKFGFLIWQIIIQ